MFRSDGNRMRHEGLGNSRNAIVKPRVGALEKTRLKWVKLDSILGGTVRKTTTKDKKKLLTETLNNKNWDEGCNPLSK